MTQILSKGQRVKVLKYQHVFYPCNRWGEVTLVDHPFYEVQLDPPTEFPMSIKAVRCHINNLETQHETDDSTATENS